MIQTLRIVINFSIRAYMEYMGELAELYRRLWKKWKGDSNQNMQWQLCRRKRGQGEKRRSINQKREMCCDMQRSVIKINCKQNPYFHIERAEKSYHVFITIDLDCIDDPDGYDGYKCAEKPDYCTSSGTSPGWYRLFTSRCKKTCKLCPGW